MQGSKQTIYDEFFDEDYDPDEAEVHEYAKFLAMDPIRDKEFLWIAREGLKAPLPENWKAVQTEDSEIYYFNFKTGESIWDHPCDKHYKNLFQEEKKKAHLKKQTSEPSSSSTKQTSVSSPATNSNNNNNNNNYINNNSNKSTVKVPPSSAKPDPFKKPLLMKDPKSESNNASPVKHAFKNEREVASELSKWKKSVEDNVVMSFDSDGNTKESTKPIQSTGESNELDVANILEKSLSSAELLLSHISNLDLNSTEPLRSKELFQKFQSSQQSQQQQPKPQSQLPQQQQHPKQHLQPEPQQVSKSQHETQPKSKLQSSTSYQTSSQPIPQSHNHPSQLQSQLQSQPQLQSQLQPQTLPYAHAHSQSLPSQPQSLLSVQSPPQPQPLSQPSQLQSQIKNDFQTQPQPQSQPQPQPQNQTQQPQLPLHQSQTPPQPHPQPQPQSHVQIQAQPQLQSQPTPQTQSQPQSQPTPLQSQPIYSQPPVQYQPLQSPSQYQPQSQSQPLPQSQPQSQPPSQAPSQPQPQPQSIPLPQPQPLSPLSQPHSQAGFHQESASPQRGAPTISVSDLFASTPTMNNQPTSVLVDVASLNTKVQEEQTLLKTAKYLLKEQHDNLQRRKSEFGKHQQDMANSLTTEQLQEQVARLNREVQQLNTTRAFIKKNESKLHNIQSQLQTHVNSTPSSHGSGSGSTSSSRTNSSNLRETLSEINRELEHVLGIIRQGSYHAKYAPSPRSASTTTHSSPISSSSSNASSTSSPHSPRPHHSHSSRHHRRHSHRQPYTPAHHYHHHPPSSSYAPSYPHHHSTPGYHPRSRPNAYHTYPPPGDGVDSYSVPSIPLSNNNHSYQASLAHYTGDRTVAIEALQRHSSWLRSLKDKIDFELTKNSSRTHAPHSYPSYPVTVNYSPRYSKHVGSF